MWCRLCSTIIGVLNSLEEDGGEIRIGNQALVMHYANLFTITDSEGTALTGSDLTDALRDDIILTVTLLKQDGTQIDLPNGSGTPNSYGFYLVTSGGQAFIRTTDAELPANGYQDFSFVFNFSYNDGENTHSLQHSLSP